MRLGKNADFKFGNHDAIFRRAGEGFGQRVVGKTIMQSLSTKASWIAPSTRLGVENQQGKGPSYSRGACHTDKQGLRRTNYVPNRSGGIALDELARDFAFLVRLSPLCPPSLLRGPDASECSSGQFAASRLPVEARGAEDGESLVDALQFCGKPAALLFQLFDCHREICHARHFSSALRFCIQRRLAARAKLPKCSHPATS